MGAVAIRFVEFAGGCAGGVDGEADFFEISNEFFASGADEELGIAEGVAKACVDAVDAVADERVDGGEAAGELNFAFVIGAEVVADEGPVGKGGGGAALMARGIAIEVHL